NRPHRQRLSCRGDGLGLHGVERVRIQPTCRGIAVAKVIAAQKALNGERGCGVMRMKLQRHRRAGVLASNPEYCKFSECRAVVAAGDGFVRAAEPRIDLLDVRDNRRNEDELRRADLASSHSSEQQLQSYPTGFAVEEVPLIADDEGDAGEEARL